MFIILGKASTRVVAPALAASDGKFHENDDIPVSVYDVIIVSGVSIIALFVFSDTNTTMIISMA